MRGVLLLSLAAAALAGPAAVAQQNGDVLMTLLFFQNNAFNQGRLVYFDPTNPATVTTIASNATPNAFHNWVRMAPNNLDMVVSEVVSNFTTSNLVQFDVGGNATTLTTGFFGGVAGFELDGDNTWICVSAPTVLTGVDATTGKMTTFSMAAQFPTFNEVCIVREPGLGYLYAIGNFTATSVGVVPKIYGATRKGVVTTVVATNGDPLLRVSGIEYQANTGDLIVTDFIAPELNRVNPKTGKVTPISFPFSGANGLKLQQDGTGYVVGFFGTANAVLKFDFDKNAIVSMYTFTQQIPSTLWGFSGVEVYGSRVLTVNGKGGPGATIQVNIRSLNPQAAGASYQLALSTGRRPGVKLPNGEWLHLNVTDPLFVLSAQNLLGGITKNFAGQLNPQGVPIKAPLIQLPAGFPSNLGITIFVAGVMFNQSGIVQVTNTHWFEL